MLEVSRRSCDNRREEPDRHGLTGYIPPVKINEVMRAAGIGKVVASKCPKRQVGDEVEGTFGWQE